MAIGDEVLYDIAQLEFIYGTYPPKCMEQMCYVKYSCQARKARTNNRVRTGHFAGLRILTCTY